MQMLQNFQQFAQQFKGNPQQVINNLVTSGQLSQEQLSQLQGQAQSILSIFRK